MTRVLLVEDEPDLRLLARTLLELDGHEVTEAGSGEAALSLLAEQEFDVLLLDIQLPGISGWDVLVRLQNNVGPARLGIIVFSAHVGPVEAMRARELGAAVYLTKPYDHDELLRAVAASATGN